MSAGRVAGAGSWLRIGLVTASLLGTGAAAVESLEEPPAVAAFDQRVQEYVKLSKQAKAGLPRLGSKASAEKIDKRVEDHADGIRKLRAGAKPGDVFAPDIVERIAGIVHDEVKGRQGANERAAIEDDMPRKFKLEVNADYPSAEPLATVPPNLLMRLPQLPEEVEYRFVGRDLVLRDVKANLVVDFIHNCLPPS